MKQDIKMHYKTTLKKKREDFEEKIFQTRHRTASKKREIVFEKNKFKKITRLVFLS